MRVLALGAALATMIFAAPSRARPITLGALPPGAQHAIDQETHGRPLAALSEEGDDARAVYDVRFHTLTEGNVEVIVDRDGNLLQRLDHVGERSGEGP